MTYTNSHKTYTMTYLAYQVHLDEDGTPLNSGTTIMLEALRASLRSDMRVC